MFFKQAIGNSIGRVTQAVGSIGGRKQQSSPCKPVGAFGAQRQLGVKSKTGLTTRFPGPQAVKPALFAQEARVPKVDLSLDASQNGASEFDYDLFTIGAGSGGVRASRMASQYGFRVAICEKPYAYVSSDTQGGVGGTCVLRGCVPKKLMVFASHFVEQFEDSLGYGWQIPGQPSNDWHIFMEAKRKELDRLNGIYKSILDKNNVDLIQGVGKVIDKNTVEVDGRRFKVRYILVATGGHSIAPPIPGVDLTINSDEILDIKTCPKKILIVGAGYIAMEFASIFNNLGAETHLYYRSNDILKGFDVECRQFLGEQLAMKGIHFVPMSQPEKIVDIGNGMKKVTLKNIETNKVEEKEFDTILMATGRAPNTKNIGLEEVGVKLSEKGFIEVDEYSKTSVDNIYSIGDVSGRIPLTPVAIMEGMQFAKTVALNQPSKPDYHCVPSAVFTQPQMSSVGMTQEQAEDTYGEVDVYASSFRPMMNTISGNPGKALMKILVNPKDDTVIGAHMVGPEAAEIVQGLAIAVKFGLKKAQLDSVVGLHPTSAEEFVSMYSPSK